MNILRAQFLVSCRELKNGTNYFGAYDINETIQLQNIIVSGTPYYDSVSLNKFSLFNLFKSFKLKYVFLEGYVMLLRK